VQCTRHNQPPEKLEMTVFDAAIRSGLTPYTIRLLIRRGELVASKPLGNRHGWQISESQFKQWMAERQRKGSNEDARKRYLQEGAGV
jgi:hypothetical protein